MATGRIPTTANSPLTAKGDIFTYSTGSAKLAVGNDGETIVADSSTATGLRYQSNFAAGKNKIINGDFYVNQRSFSSTTSSAVYTYDRWATNAVDGTVTYSAQTFTPGTAPVVGYEGKNFLRCVTTGQTLTTARANIAQKIESVRTFAGQTVTLSFYAKANTGTPELGLQLQQSFGTGGSPSTAVNLSSKVTISTSWTRYSATFNVASIAGKTIGTNNDDFLLFQFWFSGGSSFSSLSGGIGIQSNTFEIWGVQVENGSTATAFQTATGTIQGELAACQRYYQFVGGTANGFPMATFYNSASSQTNRVPISFPVQMRTAPTITKNGTWSGNAGQPSAGYISSAGFSFMYDSAGSGMQYIFPDTTDDTLTISAEL